MLSAEQTSIKAIWHIDKAFTHFAPVLCYLCLMIYTAAKACTLNPKHRCLYGCEMYKDCVTKMVPTFLEVLCGSFIVRNVTQLKDLMFPRPWQSICWLLKKLLAAIVPLSGTFQGNPRLCRSFRHMLCSSYHSTTCTCLCLETLRVAVYTMVWPLASTP